MTLQQQFAPYKAPLHIHTGSFNSAGIWGCLDGSSTFALSGAWPANNRAFYTPIFVPFYFTVARFMVPNGSAVSGNFDVGLYSNAGSRLIHTGSTAQSGTSVVQYVDVTDQGFPPGAYYLALVVSTTSARIARTVYNQQATIQAIGILQENLGATTLPTTMTGAATASTSFWHCGFTQSATL